MRIIEIPIEGHVTNTLKSQKWTPVTMEEAMEWARQNENEKYIVCPGLCFNNGWDVGIHNGDLVVALGELTYKATRFLVK